MAYMKVSSEEVFTSYLIFILPQLLLDQGKLTLKDLFFSLGHLQVKLKTTMTLQLLKTHPTSPSDTDTIEDEGAADVNLKIEKFKERWSSVHLCCV